MTLADHDKLIQWEKSKEDDKSYYFVLTDTYHHCTYDVVLIKDTGEVMVNGYKLDNMPRNIQQLIAPRVEYFKAVKKHSKKDKK